MPFFFVTVPDILEDNAFWIQKSVLGETESNMVFSLVFDVFAVIPIKPGAFHGLEGNTAGSQ